MQPTGPLPVRDKVASITGIMFIATATTTRRCPCGILFTYRASVLDRLALTFNTKPARAGPLYNPLAVATASGGGGWAEVHATALRSRAFARPVAVAWHEAATPGA